MELVAEKIPYSARDNLKIWNRRFYEEKNSDFREWPIQIELFDASKSTPRYLFKPNLRMALRSDGKLQPAGSDERVYWSSNSLGFRGPEIPFVKAAGALRVVCLGASTTEGVQSDDETYPHFLQQELDVLLAGRAVEVVNAGYHGENIDDLQEIFIQKVLPLKPDIVIFYEAANNIDWSEFLTATPQSCWEDCWLQQRSRLYSYVWKRSALFRLISEGLGRNQYRLRPLTHVLDESLPKRSITHYRTVLDELVREATDNDVVMILSSFQTLAKGDLTVTPEENPYLFHEVYLRMYPLTPGEVARVYDLFNRQSAAVAREVGVPYAELSPDFSKDARYFTFDYIHLSPEGNRLLAKLLAAHVVRSVQIGGDTSSGHNRPTRLLQGARRS